MSPMRLTLSCGVGRSDRGVVLDVDECATQAAWPSRLSIVCVAPVVRGVHGLDCRGVVLDDTRALEFEGWCQQTIVDGPGMS